MVCTAVFSVVRVGAGVYALFYDSGPGGVSAALFCDVCRSNLLLICLPAGTKRFKSAAGDHITEFCAQIVRFLRRVDPPNNVCPSIHVSSTVAVHLTICHAASVRNKKRSVHFRGLSRFWFVFQPCSSNSIRWSMCFVAGFWAWFLTRRWMCGY